MQTGIRIDTSRGGGISPETLRAWQTGQMLKAMVVSGTPPEAGGGRAVLRIGNADYAVRSQTPLRSGETLQLVVKRTQPELLLQRVAANPAETAPKTQASVALDKAVTALLTRQSGLAAGLQTLLAKLPQLSQPTTLRLETLFASLPSLPSLTQAEGLRSALAATGHQLEANLQHNRPPVAADLKAQLVQTLAGLSPADARAVRATLEGMNARISLNQLHSVSQASAQGSHWLVELPLHTAQDFQALRLEIDAWPDEAPDTPAASPDWSVRLQLNLPELGPLEARLSSVGGSVAVRFWAERAPTAARIEAALPELASAWRDKGLQPGVMQAFPGHAPSTADEPLGNASSLVDTRA